MSLETFSRFVRVGYKYKICPLQLTLEKSTTTWKIEKIKQESRAFRIVNSVGCFLLFVTNINMLVQIIRDFRRPLYLAMDIGFSIMLINAAYTQFLFFTNSGCVQFLNSFFTCSRRASKQYFLCF